MPILMINGTEDPLVGYRATSLSVGLPAVETFAFAAARDRREGEPVTTFETCAVRCETYEHCADDVEVTLCTVDGMGHRVPGMVVESDTYCITKLLPLGMPNNEIDRVEVTLDFLLRFTR